MNKIVPSLAFAIAGLLAAAPTFAQTRADNGGWFVNGSVGRTSINKGPYDNNDTGYAGNFGYRWAVSPSLALGVEAGYNDLGNIHVKHAFTSDPVVNNTKSELHGWTTGVNGHFNLTPEWYVSARTGIYGWRGHGLSNSDNPLRKSVSKTDWYGGAGFGYDFASNWSVGVNYDYYHANKNRVDLSTDMVSVGAEYRF